MHAEAYQLHTLATVTKLAAGAKPGAEASLTKLWWSEIDVELHELALDLLGPEAEINGPWSKAWQFALAGPIYAGTNRSEEHTSELQSLMRISYAVFCLKKKKKIMTRQNNN